MVMVCRLGESHAMASMLKGLSTVILQEGGVVRGISNLGDRVLCKNMKTVDGVHQSVGRFMQVEFYGNVQTRKLAEAQALSSSECMRLFSLKAKEEDSERRLLNLVNKEMSPFQDRENRDSILAEEVLQKYRLAEEFNKMTQPKSIRRHSKKVHAWLKTIEQGENHEDAKLLQEVNEGILPLEDVNVKKYITKRYHTVKGRFASPTF